MTTGNISKVRQSALAFAAQVKEGDALDGAYSFAIKAKEDNASTPYVIFSGLRDQFGTKTGDGPDDYNLDVLLSWPVPGDGTKDQNPGSNNPDYWEVTTGDGKIKGSFYNDLADNTPQGKVIVAELAKIAEGMREGGADNDYRRMGKPEAKKAKNKWAARQSTLRGNTRIAMKFLFMMVRINDMDNCGVETWQDKDKDSRNGGACVFDTKVRANVKYYTVRGLLALKPGKAQDEGGGWEKLVASDARPPKTPASSDVVKLDNMKKVESAMSDLVVLFEGARDDDDKRKQLFRTLNAAGSDGLLANIFRIENALGHITSTAEFEKRWNNGLSKRQNIA